MEKEKVIKKTKKQKVKYYLEHYKKMSYAQLRKPMGYKSVEGLRTWCKRSKMPNKRINSQSTRASKQDKEADVVEALKQRGKTQHEIEGLGFSFTKVKKLAEKEKDFTLYIQRNEYNEKVLVLIRNAKEEFEILPRAYSFARQKDGQPYIWFKFPRNFPSVKNDKDVDKLSIFPLADAHYGSIACDVPTLLQDVEYIRTHDNVYTFLNGDLIENASKLSVASGVYEQNRMPNEQIADIIKILSPIAHKILFSIQGNHEERVYRHMGIDIGKLIAEKLKVPYFDEPIYADLLWRNYRWTLFSQHGASNSQTKGGKMNAATRPTEWLEFTNFIVYSHVHDKTSNEVSCIVRDTINHRLIIKKQYVVILSAYLKYFHTYGSKKGWKPPTTGRSSLNIYSNGKYYVAN